MPEAVREDEERAAGFVLFRAERGAREYLLLRHRGQEYWAFPKGRVDPGESELQAAIREVREETGEAPGTPIEEFRVVSRYPVERVGRPHSKTVTFFLAPDGGSPVRLSEEHDDARWLPYREARETLTYEEARRVLDEAERTLALREAYLEARSGREGATEYALRREEENECVLSHANLSIKRFFSLDHAVYASGALPAKMKELLGLAASTVLRCNDCISYHLTEAVRRGATDEEIVETLGVALIVGGSITIPHLRHAMQFLPTVDRGLPSSDPEGTPSRASSKEEE